MEGHIIRGGAVTTWEHGLCTDTHTHMQARASKKKLATSQSQRDREDVQPEETDTQHLTEMSGGPLSCFSKQGILLLSILHYGVGISMLFNKGVGDSVELPSGLERKDLKSMEWKYNKMVIAEFEDNFTLPRSQFEGRLEMNDNNFSLTIRELTLQDSGEFLVSAASNEGHQIPTMTIHLQIHEPISKVAIQKKMKLLANQSCSVWLLCNVSVCSNLSYTWERGNETYRDDQQIHFSLSPADGDISVTCNASDSVSWKSASTTVKCSNDTTTPEYDTWLAWNWIYIWVSVGGAVVLILTVAVAVYYCRGRCNTADLTDNTRMKDTRSNSQVISIYETVGDLAVPRLNTPQTLYDKITFGRQPEAPSSSNQEVL